MGGGNSEVCNREYRYVVERVAVVWLVSVWGLGEIWMDGCQGARAHSRNRAFPSYFPLPLLSNLSIDIQVTFNYARRRENCEVLAKRG